MVQHVRRTKRVFSATNTTQHVDMHASSQWLYRWVGSSDLTVRFNCGITTTSDAGVKVEPQMMRAAADDALFIDN